MRLWHEALIPYLPRQQLLGQHRECCALRGLGWGKKHATVDYVFEHPYAWLVTYHSKVMDEMHRRGYDPDRSWYMLTYRGKRCSSLSKEDFFELWSVFVDLNARLCESGENIYPEHDDAYLQECLANLAAKGIKIDMEGKI